MLENVITRLEAEDGNVVEKEEDIVREITDFFKRLYKSEGLSYQGIEGIEWQPISSHLANWLEWPFEEEEVTKAIFDCDGSKVPSPTGFTMELFQTQWETMKEDILRVLFEFSKDEIIHCAINERTLSAEGAG